MTDIIVIDDNKTILRLMEKMLAPYELNTMTYTCAHDGIEAVVQQKPKVVFLDLMMPKLNGDEVIIKLSEAKVFKDTTIYLLTGQDLCDTDHMKLMTLGFMKILKKPLKEEQLGEILAEHFGQTGSQAA